jgi:hypothetical protein
MALGSRLHPAHDQHIKPSAVIEVVVREVTRVEGFNVNNMKKPGIEGLSFSNPTSKHNMMPKKLLETLFISDRSGLDALRHAQVYLGNAVISSKHCFLFLQHGLGFFSLSWFGYCPFGVVWELGLNVSFCMKRLPQRAFTNNGNEW